eukprot:scaffold1808_cov360-Prasinococcus_capsulatus_cf.AAC.24
MEMASLAASSRSRVTWSQVRATASISTKGTAPLLANVVESRTSTSSLPRTPARRDASPTHARTRMWA